MNLENFSLILRNVFKPNPLPKPELSFVSKAGIILYSMNSTQSPSVILLNKSSDIEKTAITKQWELASDLDQLNKALITRIGQPLLKNLSSERIEHLNETGAVGAICLTSRERVIMEAYISRHWDRVQAFSLEQILEYGNDRILARPEQIDIFIRFNSVLTDNKITKELELILG